MQRRAAAAYFAFFLVVGLAAYGYIGVAQETRQPQFDLDGTQIQEGGEATIDGTLYTLANVSHASGGGHGGGGGLEGNLTWENETTTMSVDLSEGQNVTLANGGQYFAHFPDDGSVEIVPVEQYGSYAATVDEREYFHERINGLWGIVLISGIAAVVLISTAYLPVRG